jgi:hypothetical protein
MNLRYGQQVQLKSNVALTFFCNGIIPLGESGYRETHYKIKFDYGVLVLSESLIGSMFEDYNPNSVDSPASTKSVDYKKLKKDELIALLEARDGQGK